MQIQDGECCERMAFQIGSEVMGMPGTALFVDPKPGDVVLFKWSGGWRRGIVQAGERPGRLPIKKEATATPREAKTIYWRNRTQLFEPFGRTASGEIVTRLGQR